MQAPKSIFTGVALVLGVVSASAMAAGPVSQDRAITVTTAQQLNPARAGVIYAFSALDRNQDGSLSRSEVPKTMQSLRRYYLQADFNDNGRLSPRECELFGQGRVPAYTGTSHTWNVQFTSPEPRDALIANR